MNYFSLLLSLFFFYSFSCSGAAYSELEQQKEAVNTDLKEQIKGAIRDNNRKLIQQLLEEYPDILSLRSSSGNTPLHYAYHYNRKSLVTFFIKKGASQEVKNNDGRKPSDYKKKSYFDVTPALPYVYDLVIGGKK